MALIRVCDCCGDPLQEDAPHGWTATEGEHTIVVRPRGDLCRVCILLVLSSEDGEWKAAEAPVAPPAPPRPLPPMPMPPDPRMRLEAYWDADEHDGMTEEEAVRRYARLAHGDEAPPPLSGLMGM